MIADTVLLVNLTPEEVQYLEELIAHAAIEDLGEGELKSVVLASTEDAKPFLEDEATRLVIWRLDEQRKRIDQDIRRFKRFFSKPLPLLVLAPADHTRKVKDYLKAGADEFWILPLDSAAFPPRLYVLLELGQGIKGNGKAARRASSVETSGSSLWVQIGRRLRRLFATDEESKLAVTIGIGTLLIAGKWHRIRRLGFGSFGEVCLVQQEGKGDLAVAKIPHDQRMNRKFLREAVILRTLAGHPNAVQLKEVVKEEGKIVLIQEYVEGSTLHDLLAEGMDGAAKENAFLELLEVVAYAHQHNIMHRDIKPENIIITPNGHLKLLDFGTSKDLSRGSISSTVIGSRPYMAPEQIMGKSRIASDVWALGVILYSLSTEFLPFYDENEKQLMDFILETEPERPRDLEPDIPEGLEFVILKCLQKEWSERYLNALDLRKDLMEKFPKFGAGEVLPQH